MKYAKQTGGRGQYGHVKIHLYPGRAGLGLRLRERDHAGLDSEGIHQAGRRRDQGSAHARRARRLSGRRRADRAVRRLVPRRRLVGNGVQDRRIDGVPGCREEGQAGAARARDAGRGRRAQGTHGRRHGQPVEPARPDPVAGGSRRHADHQRARAALGDVRLRDRPPVADAGTRDLLDALRSLRAGAESRERGSRGAGSGK